MSFEHPRWLAHVPPEGDPEDEPYELRWVALGFISLAIMLIGVDISVTGVAAPALSSELNASNSDIQWIFDGFTLALGGFVLLGSGLGDRFGRKGAFQVGMIVFALGSLVAAFASTPAVLIGGRVVTGLGAALVMPAALTMLSVIFPPDERSKAIGIWAAVAAVGMALGPVIGGVLLQSFWFGSVFLINVPVCLVAMAGAALVLPTSRRPGHVSLDLFGAVLSVIGLTGLVGGIIEAPARGLTSPVVLGLLAAGIVASAVFIWWELRTDGPLFDLRIFRIPRVVAGALTIMVVYVTFNGTQELLIPQYLQYVSRYSSVTTGLLLLPVGIVFGTMSTLAPILVERRGAQQIFRVGLAAMVIGLGIYGLLAWWGGYGNVLLGTLVFFSGVGLVVAPSTSAIMLAVPTSKAGDGSAANQISRQVGGALGVAISGSIYAAIYQSQLQQHGPALQGSQLATADTSVSGALQVAGQLPAASAAQLQEAATQATAVGMSWAFLFVAIVTVVVLIVATRLLKEPADERR